MLFIYSVKNSYRFCPVDGQDIMLSVLGFSSVTIDERNVFVSYRYAEVVYQVGDGAAKTIVRKLLLCDHLPLDHIAQNVRYLVLWQR